MYIHLKLVNRNSQSIQTQRPFLLNLSNRKRLSSNAINLIHRILDTLP